MRPRIPIHDPRFAYTSACATDIRATFQRERQRLAALAEQKQRAAQVESLLTRRIHNIFDARRREIELVNLRG